jgi:hypothetical protein
VSLQGGNIPPPRTVHRCHNLFLSRWRFIGAPVWHTLSHPRVLAARFRQPRRADSGGSSVEINIER